MAQKNNKPPPQMTSYDRHIDPARTQIIDVIMGALKDLNNRPADPDWVTRKDLMALAEGAAFLQGYQLPTSFKEAAVNIEWNNDSHRVDERICVACGEIYSWDITTCTLASCITRDGAGTVRRERTRPMVTVLEYRTQKAKVYRLLFEYWESLSPRNLSIEMLRTSMTRRAELAAEVTTLVREVKDLYPEEIALRMVPLAMAAAGFDVAPLLDEIEEILEDLGGENGGSVPSRRSRKRGGRKRRTKPGTDHGPNDGEVVGLIEPGEIHPVRERIPSLPERELAGLIEGEGRLALPPARTKDPLQGSVKNRGPFTGTGREKCQVKSCGRKIVKGVIGYRCSCAAFYHRFCAMRSKRCPRCNEITGAA